MIDEAGVMQEGIKPDCEDRTWSFQREISL
jgi:hypothetical protein